MIFHTLLNDKCHAMAGSLSGHFPSRSKVEMVFLHMIVILGIVLVGIVSLFMALNG